RHPRQQFSRLSPLNPPTSLLLARLRVWPRRARLTPMEIRIDVPDELAATLRRTPEELEYDLRLRALAGLVERGLLSTGRAAELAGVSRRELLDWCGRWHIRVHRWETAEGDAELAFARGKPQ